MLKKILLSLGSLCVVASAATSISSCGKVKINDYQDLLKEQNHDTVYDQFTVGGKTSDRIITYNLVDMENMDQVLTAAQDILVKPSGPSIIVLSTTACPFCRALMAGHNAGDVEFKDYHGWIEDSKLYEHLKSDKYKDYTIWIIEDKAAADHDLPWNRDDELAKLWMNMFKAIGWKFRKDSAVGTIRTDENGVKHTYKMESPSTPIVIMTSSTGAMRRILAI